MSPKVLVVAPHCILSRQYHFRRSEIWKVLDEPAEVKISNNDVESELQIFYGNNYIKNDKRDRHRLIGLDSWGIIAEIWQHTDQNDPSDEDDIVRLQVDFGR